MQLNDIVPDSVKGTVSGAYYLCWGVGFFFGPLIMGQLGKLPGHNIGFQLLSLVMAATAALLMTSALSKEQPAVEQ